MADAEGAAEAVADTTDAGAASLDEMAEIMASETDSADGGTAVPAETETPAPEGEKPAEEKPAEEKPAEAPANETPDAAQLRKGFAALARDRQKMHAREERAERAIAEAQAHIEKAKQHDALLQRLKASPADVLREFGGEELITAALNQIAASEKSPAEREIEKLRAQIDADKAAAKQAQQEQAIATWRNDVVSSVRTAGEKYDLVNAFGQYEQVIEVIAQYHQKYGQVLSTDIAAQAVEKSLEDAGKRSKKFGPRDAVKPPATVTPAKKAGNGTTLTSVASGEHPPSANGYPMDDDQRFQAVMQELAASGQL